MVIIILRLWVVCIGPRIVASDPVFMFLNAPRGKYFTFSNSPITQKKIIVWGNVFLKYIIIVLL